MVPFFFFFLRLSQAPQANPLGWGCCLIPILISIMPISFKHSNSDKTLMFLSFAKHTSFEKFYSLGVQSC